MGASSARRGLNGLIKTGLLALGLFAISMPILASSNMVDKIDYGQIRAILEKRCIVCHGCYDAPCQLKLSSYTGVARGASKQKIYDGERITNATPTRLFIDAQTTEEWRQKGFYSVLSAKRPGDSVLYRILKLKEKHPQPTSGRLPNDDELGLGRKDYCPKSSEFDDFSSKHPNWGMPYAMPNLPKKEYEQLLAWAKLGAPGDLDKLNNPVLSPLAIHYEAFLNQDPLKYQLMGRYVYEHLFLGHLHFSDTDDRTFYQLVRSKTPPGMPIELIPSVRPYDNPHVKRVYYRLRPVTWAIVQKDHLVYYVDDKTESKYRAWFIVPPYKLHHLPGYDPVNSTNPFKIYAKMPAMGRYRFLLDQAQFIIGGFIKGPVCRGQVALNVIEDRFWVMFFDPEHDVISHDTRFLARQADNLRLPSEEGTETFRMLATYTKYQNRQKLYLEAKKKELLRTKSRQKHDFGLIWKGDGQNANAILTIMRNQDSATIVKGFYGSVPKTAWVLDYPLLERIQYLLVSGFDVYGNVGHQLNTRLYMDFLRMEGENNFLSFMPDDKRELMRNFWYRNTPEEFFRDKLQETKTDITYHANLGIEAIAQVLPEAQGKLLAKYKLSVQKDAAKVQVHLLMQDFFQQLFEKFGHSPVLNEDPINRQLDKTQSPFQEVQDANPEDFILKKMKILASCHGEGVSAWPDVSFLRVNKKDGSKAYFTLVLDKGYYNVTSLLFDEQNRVKDEDAVTVLSGLKGSYPNMFFNVNESDLKDFLILAKAVSDQHGLSRWVETFGVRRTSTKFWPFLDDLHREAQQENPIQFGLFDLNRYRND
ncbi:fatty acid cis/trans isomerase [Hydrogenovibrio marinus]|uniref:Peptidylprolyl isomerase n=1 Tax=Hydrogenovibrio marinus TaxID=28885 RepID=A0A066ZUM8_HYDMR|nr:fatty acid cis/trans isomerase [Hydrogenovibrio marinus]KDN95989.1 hypothetical protein EI16_06795 [Hydrogenovibrio marinus]BBN58518.1 9-hexadecenoic acid cis-trans isomerase [Hydrogenovibrio marinus]